MYLCAIVNTFNPYIPMNNLKKISLSLLAMLCISASASAQAKKGYAGFVDVGYSVGINESSFIQSWAEVSTTHGYQVNPYFFVGGGVAFQFVPEYKDDSHMDAKPYWKRDGSTEIPLYVNLKWNILKMKVSPVIDARLGHYLTNGSGAYATVGAGCRVSLKSRQAIYGMITASFSQFTYQQLHMERGKKYNYRYTYQDLEDQEMYSISFRFGYEF